MKSLRSHLVKQSLRLLTLTIGILLGSTTFSQDTLVFNFTGAPDQFVVPSCINGDIQITVAGATGGSAPLYANSGGVGALLTGTISVSGGDVIDITVGGQGGVGNASGGYPSGGTGFAATGSYSSAGGGGATIVDVNGTPTVIAAGGGGAGGGGTSTSYTVNGGAGGCNTGQVGSWNNTWNPGYSPYAQGGQGGTQVAPGNGGNPWAGVPPGGSNGIGGTGGMGGNWNTASGGGGGGGYFGGGGGGNDGCCTGANAGGGGGGGSSLWPIATVGCTQGGATPGNGYVIIILPACETTICEGDTAMIDFTPQFPLGATNYTVTPALGVYQATPGSATIGLFPTDSTTYDITATVAGNPFTIQWPVHVIPKIEPDAGLDDSLCFDPLNGVQLNATLHNDGVFSWSMNSATTFSGAAGNALFTPSNTVLNPTVAVTLPGYYEFFLIEEDTLGICPDGVDTVFVYFSEEMASSTHTNPICFGDPTGTLTVVTDVSAASGNLGASTFTIDDGSGPITQNNGNFTGLYAGTYTVTSTDYLGCSHDTTITLVDPTQITMSLVSSDTTICQNGTATLVAQGNGAPAGGTYTYTWSQGTSTTNQNVITPTPAGTNMSVDVSCVTDLGCPSDTVTLNIDHYNPITAMITMNDSICPGYDSQHQVSNESGGFQGYSYDWTANGAPMPDISNQINVNPTSNTQYCVSISDNCETTPFDTCVSTIMRTVPDVYFADPFDGCNPSTVVVTNTTNNVITDSVTWFINGVYYQGSNYLDSVTVTFNEIGEYDVTLEVYSEYGCHDSKTITDYIVIHDVPDPLFYINPNPTTIFDTGVDMNNITSGANNTYYWEFPGGTPSNSVVENPSVLYPEGVVGDYPVTLTVTNEWGCVADVTAVAHVLSDVILYSPNIFTPDGDEFNETWRVHIDGIDIYQFHLTMFNRWGEPVWESFNQIAEWDGSYGNGDLVPDGTYVWVIECREAATDKKYEFRGHVTVLK